MNGGGSAGTVQELRRRIHLEGPDCQDQPAAESPAAAIEDPVADLESNALLPRKSQDRRGEGDSLQAPDNGRDGQVSPIQGMVNRGVAPFLERTSEGKKGLDGEAPLRRFDGSVLTDQGLGGPPALADDGPIGLLSREGAREAAARRLASERLKKRIGRRELRERPHGHLPDPVTGASSRREKTQPHEPRLGLGQKEIAPLTTRALHGARGLPIAAVFGPFEDKSRGRRA